MQQSRIQPAPFSKQACREALGTGLTPRNNGAWPWVTGAGATCTIAISAWGSGLPRPHLRRDWAHPAHICAGTGLTPPTSAPGLGSTRPHLRRARQGARRRRTTASSSASPTPAARPIQTSPRRSRRMCERAASPTDAPSAVAMTDDSLTQTISGAMCNRNVQHAPCIRPTRAFVAGRGDEGAVWLLCRS